MREKKIARPILDMDRAALTDWIVERLDFVPQSGSKEFHIAQLRHAYMQLASGCVFDQKRFADGLIAPAIRYLEERHGEQE